MSRTALVTGANGGIGSATVARLVKNGVEVIATDLGERSDTVPADADYVPFDLRSGDPHELFERLGGRGLDYLVNAAGVALFDRDGSMLTSTNPSGTSRSG